MMKVAIAVLALVSFCNAAVLHNKQLPRLHHVVLTAQQRKHMHSECVHACSPSPVESKCVTTCEVAVYSCIDETGPNENEADTEKCIGKVLAKFKETKGVEKAAEKAPAKAEKAPAPAEKAPAPAAPVQFHVKLNAKQQKHMHSECVHACSPSPVESKCVTSCEVAVYSCIDKTGPNENEADTEKCIGGVLKKFKETKGIEKAAEKAPAPAAPAPAAPAAAVQLHAETAPSKAPPAKAVQFKADRKKQTHSECVQSCHPSPVESKCVTACEVAVYSCIDETGPMETEDDTEKCIGEVLKKFKETKGVEKAAAKAPAPAAPAPAAPAAAVQLHAKAKSFLQIRHDDDDDAENAEMARMEDQIDKLEGESDTDDTEQDNHE